MGSKRAPAGTPGFARLFDGSAQNVITDRRRKWIDDPGQANPAGTQAILFTLARILAGRAARSR